MSWFETFPLIVVGICCFLALSGVISIVLAAELSLVGVGGYLLLSVLETMVDSWINSCRPNLIQCKKNGSQQKS